MHILLIGPRASGKTTIGRELADRINHPLIDLDDAVLDAFSEKSVSEVWEVHGESAWREAELKTLPQVLQGKTAVIALGGGTPVIPAAFDMIEDCRSNGQARVIYLQCSVNELTRRLKSELGDRPSLTGINPADEIGQVLQLREAIYLALADIVLDTTTNTPLQLTDQLLQDFPDLSVNHT